jgi:tetratricopeptide (TPR) repeat protein
MKKLIVVLSIVVVSVLVFAYFYYNEKNSAEDPRIVQAKYMLGKYDTMMAEKRYMPVFPLLDSIEFILNSVPGYKQSFEPGIVFNNRGSAYLSMALYEISDSADQQNLLYFALRNIDTSIVIYQNWLREYGQLSSEAITEKIRPFFPANDTAFSGKDYESIILKRVEDILLAQNETKRRLSVSYTNQGIVLRHQFRQEEAVESYINAIKLWKDNYTARNNFNVLMGKEPEDRSIIDKLFPPDKNKFD